MEEEQRLRALFHACDVNNSGRIEYDEFFTVCLELQVRESEVGAIFDKLDSNRDGCINFREFAKGFQEVSEMINFEALSAVEPDWDEFQQRLGEEAKFIPRPQQVAALYQKLKTAEPRLIRQYECVIKNFIRDVMSQNTELEKLAYTVKRTQDEAAQQLSELEEDMDQKIKNAVQECQKEEQRKAELTLVSLQHQYDANINELQLTVTKLKKLEEQFRSDGSKDESIALKRKINDFTLENDKLRKELLEAQTEIMLLQSEVDALKSDFMDQSLNLERDHDVVREYTEDRDNLTRQIEMLQSANRKLHDSNDGLRSALESSLSKYNRSLRATSSSPGSAALRSSPRLNECHSSPMLYDRSSRSSYQGEDYESLAVCDPMRRGSCEVESLSESCFDSGMSTMRDSNDYDSEVECKYQRNFERSQRTQEAFDCDASDTDVPEIHDEEAFSQDSMNTVLEWQSAQAVNWNNSGANSLQRCSSAFSPQVLEIRNEEVSSQDGTNTDVEMDDSYAVNRRNSGASSVRRCISAFSSQLDNTAGNSKTPPSSKAFKIVLAGDAAVGKSSFLLRLCKNEFHGNTSATLGVDFQMKTLVVDGEQTVLQLWDTAGQERFRSIAKSYFRRADGVLLLYDVTCERSFLNVREWVDMIEGSTTETIPIMLVGNKVDLRKGAMQEGQKCIPTSYGEKLAMTYNVLFCETSAREGANIIEAVLHLAREVRKKGDRMKVDSVTNLSSMQLNKKPSMRSCCTA
ncbi:ras and EF-hand domain-containing protein homolog isoform X1 [Hypanus sabinus]|uniref:ras and EF-hand domain-containing protein homolog isoform X1 n=2 Tax=Hypanus sabinus TaxID=79690 RepID=UPI0028C4B296|nr:ras and EF-hand domain-containing protein homolog isoform X1 [Hypanus sabinus]